METSTQPVTNTSVETEHLDKIRTILFGEQLQHQNHRFEQLEQQVLANCDDLRSQLTQQIDSLENRLTQHLSKLSEQLAQKIAAQASEIRTQTDTAIAAANQALHQTLQDEVQQHTRSIKSELEQQMVEALERLQTQIKAQKSNDKAERVHLSNLFSEISEKLNQPD